MKALLLTTLIVAASSTMAMRSANTNLHADGKCSDGPGLKVKMAQIDQLLSNETKTINRKSGATKNR